MMTYEERYCIPLGELIKNKAKAMFPDDDERQDAYARGAIWMADKLLDEEMNAKAIVDERLKES
jgi:hypothetical protein